MAREVTACNSFFISLFFGVQGLSLLRAHNTVMQKELQQKENVNKDMDIEVDSIQHYFGGINTGKIQISQMQHL